MGGKGAQGWEELGPYEGKLPPPPAQLHLHFCSMNSRGLLRLGPIQPTPASALWPFRTLAPKAPAFPPTGLPHLPLCDAVSGLLPVLSQVLSKAMAGTDLWVPAGTPLPSPEFSPAWALLLCASPALRWEAPGRDGSAHIGDQQPGTQGQVAEPQSAEGGDSLLRRPAPAEH